MRGVIKLSRYKRRIGMISISRLLKRLPNGVTLVSLSLGFLSILVSCNIVNVSPLTDKGFIFSGNLIILCALIDKLDGYLARKLKASSELGAQLDSLADLVAFGVAPSVLLMVSYKELNAIIFGENQILISLTAIFYVICSSCRLARFNTVGIRSHSSWFSGLPTTVAGVLNSSVILVFQSYGLYDSDSVLSLIPVLSLLLTSILMVSTFYIPKIILRSNVVLNRIQFAWISAIYILGLAMVYEELVLALIVLYVAIGFVLGAIYKGKIDREIMQNVG